MRTDECGRYYLTEEEKERMIQKAKGRSLAEKNPELAGQWNYEKNGDLRPEMVTYGSGLKVWWILPYDVPMDYPIKHLRGRHFDFVWQAMVRNRASYGQGCPYISSTAHAIWKGFNDIATTHSHLIQEWNFEKNGVLKPENVTAGSCQKVWWILPYDVPDDYSIEHLRGKHFVFEWESRIDARALGSGCPYFNGRLFVGYNDIATTHSHLVKEWHPTKNGDLKPTDVTAGMDKKIWWILPYDVPMDYPIEHLRGKHFVFEWKSRIDYRANGGGCPFLAATGTHVWIGFNDICTTHPEIAKTWDYDKNSGLKPESFTAGSNKRVWWKVSYVNTNTGKTEFYSWQAKIKSRMMGTKDGVPEGKLCPGLNDLASRFPSIASEWNFKKNGNLRPSDVMPGTAKKVWWIAEYDGKMEEWYMSINERTCHGRGCPGLTSSNLEKIIKTMLEKQGISFKKEYVFKGLKSSNNGRCKYDFYLDIDGLVIECDGKQHFEPIDYFGGKLAFETRKANDNIKTNYCFNNNIPLLRIPYIYDAIKDVDKIERLILDFIRTKQVPQKIIDFYSQFSFSDYGKTS